MLVRGDEDLLSAGTHSEKCHFVEGVDITHHASCLHSQISHMISDVLWGRCRGGFVSLRDNSALFINDQQCAHTLVVTDSIDPLFEVGHFKFSVTIINLSFVGSNQSKYKEKFSIYQILFFTFIFLFKLIN